MFHEIKTFTFISKKIHILNLHYSLVLQKMRKNGFLLLITF